MVDRKLRAALIVVEHNRVCQQIGPLKAFLRILDFDPVKSHVSYGCLGKSHSRVTMDLKILSDFRDFLKN